MRFFKSIKTVNSIFFLPNLQKITLNLGINHWVFIKTIDLSAENKNVYQIKSMYKIYQGVELENDYLINHYNKI